MLHVFCGAVFLVSVFGSMAYWMRFLLGDERNAIDLDIATLFSLIALVFGLLMAATA